MPSQYTKQRWPGGYTKKGKRRKRRPGAGAPPQKDLVHLLSTGKDKAYLRLTFTEDVIDKLVEMHSKVFGAFVTAHRLNKKYEGLRIQFARLVDMSIPGIFCRIEPPTWDPRGKRLWRAPNSRRFQVTIACSKVGVKPGVPPVYLEQLYHESVPNTLGGGMLLMFPDSYMEFDGPKNRVKGPTENLIVN